MEVGLCDYRVNHCYTVFGLISTGGFKKLTNLAMRNYLTGIQTVKKLFGVSSKTDRFKFHRESSL